jgi:16S rRNA pseudouridine516 synthase
MKKIRLDRFLSSAGYGTRSEVKKTIREGRVRVNGKLVRDPSFHVDPENDDVTVDGELVFYERDYYLVLNKPKGYITSTKDRELTVMELVSDVPRFENLFPVGRLDKDAEGLLIMTTDGKLAHRLTHPKWKVPRVYRVKLKGKITEEDVEPLRKGIDLGDFKALPAKVRIISSGDESEVEVEVCEGKYRQVKRMFEKIGFKVLELKRIKYGPVELGELPVGEYRNLTEEEVAELKRLVKLEAEEKDDSDQRKRN